MVFSLIYIRYSRSNLIQRQSDLNSKIFLKKKSIHISYKSCVIINNFKKLVFVTQFSISGLLKN